MTISKNRFNFVLKYLILQPQSLKIVRLHVVLCNSPQEMYKMQKYLEISATFWQSVHVFTPQLQQNKAEEYYSPQFYNNQS